ncbi:MPPV-010 ankyrin repeat protein [Magpiepox virus 2]|nr:MPPV-010 ankyrin repeat protein [Magpiepox virus 2]
MLGNITHRHPKRNTIHVRRIRITCCIIIINYVVIIIIKKRMILISHLDIFYYGPQ